MSRLFVGEIEALLQLDSALLVESDWQAVEERVAESRRSELYAWRILLRRSLRRMGYEAAIAEADVAYDALGAPYLVGCELFIGVSHSRSRVAVVVSHSPCAVDLEQISRNFLNVEKRLLSSAEQHLLASYDKERFALPLAWAAKETLYKLSAAQPLELIDDMELLAIDTQECTIECRAARGRFAQRRLTLHYHFDADHITVYYL